MKFAIAIGGVLLGFGVLGDFVVHLTVFGPQAAGILGQNGEWAHLATGIGAGILLFVATSGFLLAQPANPGRSSSSKSSSTDSV